jgi:hypothetical protein
VLRPLLFSLLSAVLQYAIMAILDEITNGQTDLVFEYVAQGNAAACFESLLAYGANPDCATKPNVETGGFMRDCRTKGETPLHRAAAFGDEEAIQLLLDAGAVIDAKDMNGETPLSWASWYCRPIPILRKLLYGNFRIRPDYGKGMEANLLGTPHFPKKA